MANHLEIIKISQSFSHPRDLVSYMPQTKRNTEGLWARALKAAPGAVMGGFLGHNLIGGPLAIAGGGLLGGMASSSLLSKKASGFIRSIAERAR